MKKLLLSIFLSILMIGLNAANVARISSTNYTTLASAFSAVQTGDTIFLLSDVSQTSKISIDREVNFVVEGNGYAITRNANVNLFQFTAAASLKFQNTTFKKGSSASNSTGYSTFYLQVANSKLTLENCTSTDFNTLYLGQNSTATIKSGTYSGNYFAYTNSGNLNVEDVTFSNTYLVYSNNGNLNIESGIFSNYVYTNSGTINVEGGVFSGSYFVNFNYKDINIHDGTFKNTSNVVNNNGNSGSHYPKVTIHDGQFTQSNWLVSQNYAELNLLGGQYNTKRSFNNYNGAKVAIKGGTFNSTYNFASNNTGGKIVVEGGLSFSAGSSYAVFQGDLSGLTTTDAYYFYPSKYAVRYVETQLRAPVTFSFYVGDELYQTTTGLTGPCSSLIDLPVDAVNGHVYTHWVDSLGDPVVINETSITGDTRFYAAEGEPVARIGEVLCGTLSSAFAFAENNDTIVLLKDIELESTQNITRNVDVVFDGDGHTIENLASENGASLFNFTTSNSVTFQNLKVETDESTAESNYSTLMTLTEGMGGNLTLKNCELKDYYIFEIAAQNKVTVDGGNLHAYYNVIDTLFGTLHIVDASVMVEDNDVVSYNYGRFLIDNGEFIVSDALIDYNYDTLIVKDGRFNLNYVVYENIGGYVNLQDGNYQSGDYIVEDNYNRDAAGEVDYNTDADVENIRGKVLVNGGKYTSEYSWIYDNYGDVEVENMEVVVIDDDFVNENYANARMLIHNATVRADDDLCDDNYGTLILESGDYKSGYGIDNYGELLIHSCRLVCDDDCIYNGSDGKVKVLGISTFDAPGDSDGAFYSNLDSITVADGFYFHPSKDATRHIEVRPMADHPVMVYYYANGSLFQSAAVVPGPIFSLPILPANSGSSIPYAYWADEDGNPFQVGSIVGDTTYVYAMVEDAVARIGNTQYQNLQEAFSAVSENDTIHLLRDVELETSVNVGQSVTFTFDGHNHAVSFNSADPVFKFSVPAHASFQNAVVSQNYDNSQACCFYMIPYSESSLALNGCEMNSEGSIFYVGRTCTVSVEDSRLSSNSSVANYNYGTLHLLNGDYASENNDLVTNNYGKLLLDDGYYNIYYAVVDYNYDTVIVQNGTFIAEYLIYEHDGGYLNIQNGEYLLDDYLVEYMYMENGRRSEVLINDGTFVIDDDYVFYENYGGKIHVVNGDFNYYGYFLEYNYEESALTPELTIDNGTFVSDLSNGYDFIYENYGIVNINCSKIVCGSEFIDDNYGPVQLNCAKMICGDDLIEDNYGASVHIIDGDYEYEGSLVGYNDENSELTIDNGKFISPINNGNDAIGTNYGTVTILCEKLVCGDDVVDDNYGTVNILGGYYESDDDIIASNEENAVLNISNATIKSYYTLLYSNYGSATFDNVNYTSTDYYVIGSNYSTGEILFNSGEYVSENATCICGSSSNDGFITLKGGNFRGKDDGISNGSGEVFFDGHVVFDVTEDTDGVLYGSDLSAFSVSDAYVFDPSVRAKNHLETIFPPDVARIGSVNYKSLKSAFAAANDNDTIVMLKDIVLSESLQLDMAKTLVLDGDGHTLTADILSVTETPEFSGYKMIEISDALQLTVKNLTTVAYDSSQYGVMFFLDNDAQAAVHFENTTFHGYEIGWNGTTDTLTFANCSSSNIYEYLIEYNYGSVTFHSGDYTTDYSIIEYNYGTAIYEDGTYTTEYVTDYNYETALCEYHDGLYLAESALVYENAAEATVIIQDGEYWSEDDIFDSNIGMIKINNGDFHSDNNIVYDNKGTLLVHDGSFAAGNDVVRSNVGTTTFDGGEYEAQHSVVGTNTGKVYVMDGNFKSVDAACLCGTTDNSGQIFLNGGTFQGNNDGVRNGTGYVLFNGIVSFDVTNDADGVLQSTDMSAIDIDDAYLFEPSKTATGHVETVLNPAAPDVARIGNVKYKTLDAAFAAAVSNDTIVLLDNITLTRTWLLGAPKNIVLDGDGYTLTADVPAPSSSSDYSGYKMIEISDALQMTVKDLTVKAVDSSKYGALFFLDNNALASLHFENTTFHGNEICWNGLKDTLTFSGCNASNVLYDIVEYNYGTVNFLNGTYQVGNAVVYENEENATLIIQDGEYTSNDYVLEYNYGTAEVNDGVYRMQEYFIDDNYGTMNFRNGKFYSQNDIVSDNYGIAIFDDGLYTTDDDIVSNNADHGVLKMLGGTYTSYSALLYSNYGSALFDNVNYTSTDYYVIGNNYSTGIIQFNSGEYVSENNYIICGSSSNEGYITLKGGLFRGKDDGINNGTGDVLFDGEVTFMTLDDSDGVLYGDTSKITISPRYMFVPSKDAAGFLQTVLKTPVFVQYFVEDTLWKSEIYYPGESIYNLPLFPTSTHVAQYDYWMDASGQRIWNHYVVTNDNRLYAHRPADNVNVTFVDGSNSETITVVNGTSAADIPAFTAVTNPNFYGWHDENMLYYQDTTRINADVTLTAFYLVGDTVCTFAELKAAVEAEKPVIILCDMIPAEDELEITANTMIAGMNPNCGLYRVSDYLDKVITVYDTISLTLLGLNVDGKDIPSDNQFIYADGYHYAGWNDEKGYDPITKHYKFADVNIIDCDMHNCNISGYRDGSVVNVEDCNLTMVNSSFTNNYSGGSGGVAYFDQSSASWYSDVNDFDDYYNRFVIRNCVLSNNEARSSGGAITLSGSYFWPDTCRNSNGWEDECPDIDGKEVLQHAGLEIWDSEISYNYAGSSSGAIDPNRCLLGLRGNTVISHNTAEGDGGVSYASSNRGVFLMYENSMLAYNTASDGGAIYCSEYTFQLHDEAKICYNHAVSSDTWSGRGGGIFLGWSEYLCKILDNASIFGNIADNYGGGIYIGDPIQFESGLIYGNIAGVEGNDIDNGQRTGVVVPTSFPARRYDSDTTGRQTIWVDPIPGISTPGYVLVPYLDYYKDENDDRFFNPLTGIVAPIPYIVNGGSDVNTVWYGLLLDYDANHGTGENYVAELGVEMYGQAVIADNMFTYPAHQFVGWNTQADGTGTHYEPNDILLFNTSSQILYAEWIMLPNDTAYVKACTDYVWNGETYTESGVYEKIFTREGQCDSLAVLVLTLAPEPLQVEIIPETRYQCNNVANVFRAEVSSESDELSYVWSTDEVTPTITVTPTETSTYALTVTDGFGCVGENEVQITVVPCGQDFILLEDTVRCNGNTFSVTPKTATGIPENTLYTWTVADNDFVTGQSAQTTPVEAPISQSLTNSSNTIQTLVYTVTPVTDEYSADPFTVLIHVFPTKDDALICPGDIYKTLEFGSCALLLDPVDLGTPTWASDLGLVLVDISNNAPADNLYTEGDNVVRWISTNQCGVKDTCEQHVYVIFPECPDAVDYEGNVYHGIRIDCDCWTQRNLESMKYSDGSDIPGFYNYESEVYPDVDGNIETFGRLYDWESAINDGADNGYGHVQGICPEGWYLPTDEKYEALNAHGAAALKSPDYWLDGGGNNSTGFTSLPAGYYDGSISRYLNLMGEAYYWSTTRVNGEIGSSSAVIRYICNEVLIQETREGLGYSVRCIKEKE